MTREGPRRSGCFVQDAPAEAMDRLESPRPSCCLPSKRFLPQSSGTRSGRVPGGAKGSTG